MSVKSKVDRKVKKEKHKIYILLLCFFICIIGILIFKTEFFLIKEIIVMNNFNISDDEIINYSGLNNSQNIFKINSKEILKKIERHPYIKSATIKRKFPSKLIIDIIERKKIAALKYMNIYIIIDEEKYIIETTSQVENEIIIEGFNIKNFIEGNKIDISESEELETTLILCKLIKKDFTTINRIKYNNGIIEVYIKDNFKVKFDVDGNIKSKYVDFLRIYNDLSNKNIDHGIIDLSNNSYPVYRPFGE